MKTHFPTGLLAAAVAAGAAASAAAAIYFCLTKLSAYHISQQTLSTQVVALSDHLGGGLGGFGLLVFVSFLLAEGFFFPAVLTPPLSHISHFLNLSQRLSYFPS